jgi:hypothetical protein
MARQGLKSVTPSERLRSEFFDAALRVRAAEQVVSQPTLQRVLGWLADYRAMHAR